MAKHFRIVTKTSNTKDLSLQLHGDFDGSSAWELLHFIQNIAGRYERVAIETGLLKNVNRFGLEVFAAHWPSPGAGRAEMVFTGPFQSAFSMA